MKTTEMLLYVLLVLFAWSNRDRIPPEYQFWKHNQSTVKVQNNSDQDLTDVAVVVWATPHKIGTIKKGTAYELITTRKRDDTEVVVQFRYGHELIDRYAGTLDEDDKYWMLITVNYAGVVVVQEGADIPEVAAPAP
ncbi:MAG: hypothetical protein EPO02_06810 [Nitrospirae bacterium]|nr:MAG: hypothetical protein EPO02_06810 [Nitrospirota bacterium]